MATWATPLADLRMFLRDTSNDLLVKDKKCFGATNGQNRTFYTFDDRLVASGNQSVCDVPLRVFWDVGTGPEEVAASGILVTDQIRGEFQLMLVASGGDLRATYHYQRWSDSELNMFLQQAANQVSADTSSDIALGLQLPAMNFAASMAYTSLAQRLQQRKADQFLLQDEPMRKEAESLIGFYKDESTRMMQDALTLRAAFYDGRQDRGKSIAYGLLKRTPQPYTPRR